MGILLIFSFFLLFANGYFLAGLYLSRVDMGRNFLVYAIRSCNYYLLIGRHFYVL